MTGNSRRQLDGSFEGTLMEWASREMQLTRLHEELLAKREALLGCSISYHKSQELRNRHVDLDYEKAFRRNDKFLKDINRVQTQVYEGANTSPSPRFTTLQKNYWAMVKSQIPLWEQDLGIRRSAGASQGHAKGHGHGQGQGARPKQMNRKQPLSGPARTKSGKKVHTK